MVASGAASFFAQKKTLYKGLEPLQWNFAKASVLTAEEWSAQPALSSAQIALPPVQAEIKPAAEAPLQEQQTFEPVVSPCGANEKPIIKNSQIAGCSKENTPVVSVQNNIPALKIKVLDAQPSCESQGRFTYTGEDRPGLLYGMCIDCLTTQFASNGEKCN